MIPPTYLAPTQAALNAIQAALSRARAELPEGIRMRQWMFAKHAPSQASAWEAAEYWYQGTEEPDEMILRLLGHLKLLARVQADLDLVLAPPPVGEPDLTLPRTRTNTIVRRAE